MPRGNGASNAGLSIVPAFQSALTQFPHLRLAVCLLNGFSLRGMFGTILNGAGILIGAVAGLSARKPMSPVRQVAIKGLLGVFTVFVGLNMTWSTLGGGFYGIGKQLLIIVLALMLGRLTGQLFRIQNGLNRLGQYAKQRMALISPDRPTRPMPGEGFLVCTVLFCFAPLAVFGAVLDGIDQRWQALAIKAVMDGLATMAFVGTFGWGVLLSVIPVVAYQGTLTLLAQGIAPLLQQHGLTDAVVGTGGMLVFCVSLIILELKKIELGDYLPSLVYAPLLAWWMQ